MKPNAYRVKLRSRASRIEYREGVAIATRKARDTEKPVTVTLNGRVLVVCGDGSARGKA